MINIKTTPLHQPFHLQTTAPLTCVRLESFWETTDTILTQTLDRSSVSEDITLKPGFGCSVSCLPQQTPREEQQTDNSMCKIGLYFLVMHSGHKRKRNWGPNLILDLCQSNVTVIHTHSCSVVLQQDHQYNDTQSKWDIFHLPSALPKRRAIKGKLEGRPWLKVNQHTPPVEIARQGFGHRTSGRGQGAVLVRAESVKSMMMRETS